MVRCAVGIAMFLAGTNLAVWLIPAMRFIADWPNMMVMRFNTSLAIVLASFALLLRHTSRERPGLQKIAVLCGIGTALIGGFTALEYFLEVNLRIDEAFMPGTFPGDRAHQFVVANGRMSLNAAVSLALLGLALSLFDFRVRIGKLTAFFPSTVFALLAALPAIFGLVGYLMNSTTFTGPLRSTNILWHTAICLLLLALGILAARPERMPVRRILSVGASGILLRWMMPSSAALLLVMGWATTQTRIVGSLSPGEGTALMLYAGLLLLFVLLLAASAAVSRQEERAVRASMAYREEEARFHALADNISQLAWMADAGGSIEWYNHRWFDYTGTTIEEMRAARWKNIHHPDHAERVTKKYRECVKRGEEWEDLFPLRGKDGNFRWFLSRARPIRDGAGRVTRWFGTNTDITEQRELTEQLAQAKEESEASARALLASAERFRFLAEAASLQVWTATPDGELDFANQEVAEYFGANLQQDVLGSAWLKFVHEDDVALASDAWRRSLASGERYEVEFRLRRHDDEHRWFLVRSQPMRDGGRIVRWFGTNTDIHDLKTAQHDAEAASRAKDDFLAALSHELRTPLTPVLLAATSLRHDERLPADVRDEIAMIERNVQLEGRLIDDLLDLTRIVRGKLPLRTEVCDLHSLLGHSLEIIREEARAKRIILRVELRASKSTVIGDPARLQQVLWNLLRNAVKFTPAGGRIDITSRDPDGAALILEVSDTGLGFAPQMAERLFLPFEQEARDGHHRFGGLGLGLAIARSIVDLHGGTIQARSDGPGSGAVFTITLPLAEGDHSGVIYGEDHATATHVAVGPLRILVVEDNEPTLAVLTKLLRRQGHEIVGSDCIASAVAEFEKAEFDLLVSDLGLPDGSGFELMQKLRDRNPSLRGIALSGYGMEEDLMRSREVGFIAHLVKPIDFDHLARTIRDLS